MRLRAEEQDLAPGSGRDDLRRHPRPGPDIETRDLESLRRLAEPRASLGAPDEEPDVSRFSAPCAGLTTPALGI